MCGHPGEDVESLEFRHDQIEDDHIRPFRPDELKGFFPVGCGRHFVSLSTQGGFCNFSEHPVIVCDYNSRHVFIPSSMRARSPGRHSLSVHASPVRRREVIHDAGEFEQQLWEEG
jgi:hypothetical protein